MVQKFNKQGWGVYTNDTHIAYDGNHEILQDGTNQGLDPLNNFVLSIEGCDRTFYFGGEGTNSETNA